MFDEREKAENAIRTVTVQIHRAHPRYPFTAAAEALDSQCRTRLSARTTDLGRGGCYLDTFSPFPQKTRVKLRITREKSSFTADAKVVYSKVGMGMGVEFTSIEPEQVGILEKWIEELSGKAPADIQELKEHQLDAKHIPPKQTGYVLNELVLALMRKGVLTEEEGQGMLQRLMRSDFLP